MPEAVDRLELVADAEQSCLGTAQRIDEGELDAVRVLKLVHHDMGEAHVPGVPHGAVVPQELERPELEVLEVRGRALCLQALVLSVEGDEQRAERGETLLGERELGRRQGGGFLTVLHRADGWPQGGEPDRGNALASQALVRPLDHGPQPASMERGGEPRRGPTSGFNRLLERRVEGPFGDPRRLDLVQDAKLRSHPGGDRMHGTHASAEAVDCRDPGSLTLPSRAGDVRRALEFPRSAASLARADRRRWTRSRSSPAARSVKVKARMRSGGTSSSVTQSQ